MESCIMAENSKHGDWYWVIETKRETLWLHAEKYEIKDGAITFHSKKGFPLLTVAAGEWIKVHAASVIDGSPVGIEHTEKQG